MSYNFDIYKKENGNYLGSAEAFDPKTATQQAILKSRLEANCVTDFGQSKEIVALDKDTFEISIAGRQYLAKRTVGNLAPQE